MSANEKSSIFPGINEISRHFIPRDDNFGLIAPHGIYLTILYAAMTKFRCFTTILHLMKARRTPLQISVFLLLFVFALAGQLVEGKTLQLRESLSFPNPSTQTQTETQPAFRQERSSTTNPVNTLASTSKQTKQISGEIVLVMDNEVFVESDNKILRLTIPSNSFIWKNGSETGSGNLSEKDSVIVTASKNGNAMRISAISQQVFMWLKIALLLAIIVISFLLFGIFFRKIQKLFLDMTRHGHQSQRMRNQLSLR